MLPIYFSGSISGGRSDLALYQKLVALLGEAGYRVLAGEVTNPAVSEGGEGHDPRFIFERDLAWIEEVARGNGVLLAEVTTPSLGVGYEIAAARYRFGIPVIALFRPEVWRRCSAMISGDPGVTLIEYDEEELEATIRSVRDAIDRATRPGAGKTPAPHRPGARDSR